MMKEDPIVEEIRSQRAKIAEKYNFNPKKIIAAAGLRQNASKHILVSFASKIGKSGFAFSTDKKYNSKRLELSSRL
jgi:hypothetical protein